MRVNLKLLRIFVVHFNFLVHILRSALVTLEIVFYKFPVCTNNL